MRNISVFVFRVSRCLISFIFRIFNVVDNRLLFISDRGRQYSCNPKYIYEYLVKSKRQYEIVWVDRGIKEKPADIKIIKYRSFDFFYYYFTSKCIISNIGFRNDLPKPIGQYRIETWHGGGAYKRIKERLNPSSEYRVRIGAKETDYHLSSCKRFTEVMIPAQRMSKEKFLQTGMPRNDIFFDYNIIKNLKDKVYKKYNIGYHKVILYAPTWRDDGREVEVENLVDAINCINNLTNEKYILLCRAHSRGKLHGVVEDIVVDVTEYPDMQELLCAADILITDYSSCMWDYSLMYKPCFIYATDIAKYKQERDFYTPMDEWPFPIATNKDELVNNILNFDEADYIKNVKRHHKALGSFEDGHACERVCKLIEDICTGKVQRR